MLTVSELQLMQSLCTESFEDFVKEFWSTIIAEKLQWNWHMSVICDELQILAERVFAGLPRLYDLVINVSPGSSKSTIASIMFPAWCWARMPSFRYIGASYAHPLALDHSRKNRAVVKSELYKKCFPHIKIQEDQDTKGYFANTAGGQRYATGAMGAVQGMHGHIIGIDDPIDPNSSISEADMYRTNNWIKETLSGRKVDRSICPMVLIMQRLHQDDPTALFLQRKRVKHICIPAEITDDVNPPELRKYYINGLMDPKRLPKDVLEETEAELGPYGYAGQFKQSPVPESGGMFNTAKLKYAYPTKLKRVVRYWDKAGTAHKTKKGRGAWTVGFKMGIDDANRIFFLDVVRVRMESYEREKLILETAAEDSVSVIIGLEQEGGSGGKESADSTLRRLLGYKVKIDVPKGDKETRADPLSVQVNAGNVYVVPSDWNDALIEEMKFFPYSSTKDQVDAASGAFALLAVPKKRVGGLRSREEVGKSRSIHVIGR